jgi:GntR family transcriptional regulator/MocR family aminotransferase
VVIAALEQRYDVAAERTASTSHEDFHSLRPGRPAVGCVQGLDGRHVPLVGSVSKSLAPAVRLGWGAAARRPA